MYIAIEPLFVSDVPEGEDAGHTSHPDAGPGHMTPTHSRSFVHLASGAIRRAPGAVYAGAAKSASLMVANQQRLMDKLEAEPREDTEQREKNKFLWTSTVIKASIRQAL